MTNLTKRALRVFTVLENYREGSDDILDSLLPFFEQVFEEMNEQIFDKDKFANRVTELYHWNFSSDIAEEFIPNFEKKGWISFLYGGNDTAVYKVTCQPKESKTSEEKGIKIEKRLHDIALEFSSFIEKISPLTAFNKTIEELSDILIEWLVSADAYSEEILKYNVHPKEAEDGKIGIFVNIPDSSTLGAEERYLAARFVKYLIDNNSPNTTDLCRIASIGLLTEVVQDFQHPVSRVNKTDLCIYLDAPIAMDFLGVSGKAAKENITTILNGVKEIGGRLRICATSVEEIKGALTGVLKRLPSERTGPTASALRRNEVYEPYVRQVAIDPIKILEKFNIEIDERTIKQNPAEHQFFSPGDYEDLFSHMTFHLEPKRREHDASVVTLIMRRRRGVQTNDLFASRYVLLTRNGMLAQFSNKYCHRNGHTPNNKLGPVIHQRQLATAIWLRTGLNHSTNEIPKRYILSACERVLEVKKGLICNSSDFI